MKPISQSGLHSRKRDETRQRLQVHALRLFAEQGYDETTTQEIASAAGVSHMTFFRHFPTKESVFEGNYRHWMADLATHLPTEGTIIDRVEVVARQIMPHFYEVDREQMLMMLELSRRTPLLRGRAAMHQQTMINDVVGLLGATELEAEEYYRVYCVVTACFAVISAASYEWLRLRGEQPIDALLAAAFAALRQQVV